MATNQTTNYQLNQWESTDQVLRTDFNADNAKLDVALADLAEGLEAETTARTAAVAAEQAERSSAVAALNTAVSKCGNCQIYYTSYIGNGQHGEEHALTLTFPAPPLAVLIVAPGDGMDVWMIRGASRANPFAIGSEAMFVTWSGNSVSWYGGAAYSHLNIQNYTYRAIALIPMDE